MKLQTAGRIDPQVLACSRVVVVPNRRGFAGSGGDYTGHGCDVEANGFAQAQDVAATIAYMSQQAYVDKTHIVVAGTSHGGCARPGST